MAGDKKQIELLEEILKQLQSSDSSRKRELEIAEERRSKRDINKTSSSSSSSGSPSYQSSSSSSGNSLVNSLKNLPDTILKMFTGQAVNIPQAIIKQLTGFLIKEKFDYFGDDSFYISPDGYIWYHTLCYYAKDERGKIC